MFNDLFSDDRDPVFIEMEKQEKLKKRLSKEKHDKDILHTESFFILQKSFGTFKNSEDLTIEEKRDILNKMMKSFISLELYENCTEIQLFINMLN